MPPKKLPPKQSQQQPTTKAQPKSNMAQNINDAPKPKAKKAAPPSNEPNNAVHHPPAIPDHEIKQSSSLSASMALEATKKAYELRQAAYGAGDPNAREEILAKAINKEIEAESFGKAAKYTRSGAFQGLAAGAGLGVQPGATLGKLTGALVGGLVSSVGAVLGGGIGSAYGAISGPFWDLGQMASQGVRSITGDWPNWEATNSQKKSLEKMVMGAQQTQKPSEEELEEMSRDDGGGMDQAGYEQFRSSLTNWIPDMPSMPSMPSMPWSQQKEQPKRPATRSTTGAATQANTSKPRAAPKGQAAPKPQNTSPKTTGTTSQSASKQSADGVKKKPKKLEVRSGGTASKSAQPAARKAPPKLGPRQKTATAGA